eukprot:182144-Pyramimonas_sp.AAC.1
MQNVLAWAPRRRRQGTTQLLELFSHVQPVQPVHHGHEAVNTDGMSEGEKRLLAALGTQTRNATSDSLAPLSAKLDFVQLKAETNETNIKRIGDRFVTLVARINNLENGRTGGGTGSATGEGP